MQSIVEAENLTKKFGEVVAVDRVSFRIGRGSFNLLIGPNGSGKTTIQRLIVGLYEPTQGSVTMFGEESSKASTATLRRIGYVSENYSLYDNLSVLSNLLFFSRLLGMDKDYAKKRIETLLQTFGAKEFLNRKVATLSRGTKQKIAICRALLADPELLVLDEPTAFLDPESAEKLREWLVKMVSDNATIIYATQRLDELSKFDANVLVLKKGRLVGYGSLDNVVRKIKGVNIEITFLGRLSEKQKKALNELNGMLVGKRVLFRISSMDEIPKVAKEVMKLGINITSMNFLDYNLR